MSETRKPTFKPNEYYEDLLLMREHKTKTFATLSPAAKASVIAYERAKCADAEREAVDEQTA